MSRYYLRTLGRLSLHEGDREGDVVLADAKALAILSYLEDTPDGVADRGHLASLLWPEMKGGRARAAMRQALYYLRRKTDDDHPVVRSDQDRLALDRRHLSTDLRAFDEARSREDWGEVLDLHQGAFLGGYSIEGAQEFRHWRESRDEGLRAGVREACRALVREGLAAGESQRALQGARRWVKLNPLDEEAQMALVRALAAAGDRAGAFQAYESYRSLLREELGESPGPALSRTLEDLRAAATGEDRAAATAVDGPAGAGAGAPAAPATEAWSPDAVRAGGAAAEGRGAAGGAGWSPLGRGLTAAVLALAVILLVAAGWRLLAAGGDAADEEGPRPVVELVVQTDEAGGEPGLREIRWYGDSAVVERVDGPSSEGIFDPGRRKVAVSLRGARGIDVAVEDLAAGTRRRVTEEAADESPVAWSPDGGRILYRAGRMEGEGDYRNRYRVVSLDGGAVDSLRLFTEETVSLLTPTADWSPLGTLIALVSDSAGNPDVWVVRPDGTGARNLTEEHDGWDGDPAFSPGGTRIAFVSDRSGNPDVWTVPAGGGEVR